MSKKVILISSLILIIGSVGAMYIWQKSSIPQLSESERKEDLKKVLGREVNEKDPQIQSSTPFESDYFKVILPAGAKRYSADEKTTGDSSESAAMKQQDPFLIENMSFDIYEPRMTVVTSVRKLPPGSQKLADVSGINLRKNNPKTYQSEESIKGDTKGLVFTKKENGQFEKAAFYIVNNKLLTFALTSPSYTKESDQIFTEFIKSLSFK